MPIPVPEDPQSLMYINKRKPHFLPFNLSPLATADWLLDGNLTQGELIQKAFNFSFCLYVVIFLHLTFLCRLGGLSSKIMS